MTYLPNLTTLAAVKAELNLSVSTFDSYLNNTISIVSDDLASRCNRTFYYTKNIVDNVSGFASVRLRTKRAPIDLTQPISVVFDSAALDPSIWKVESAENGFIYNKTGWYWTAPLLPNVQQDPYGGQENSLYQITYSGGWVTPQQALDNPLDPILSVRTLPFDVEQAAIIMCSFIFKHRNTDYTIDGEGLMSYRVKYRDNMKIPFVEDMVARRRRTGMST